MSESQILNGDTLVDALSGYRFEDLEVGMRAFQARTVTEADVTAFAGVSGDYNPLHVCEDYAEQTRFKQRIAHGGLLQGFISAALGTKLPGPGAIYMSQNTKFRAPVHIGDTAMTQVEVVNLEPAKNRVTMRTLCEVNGKTVVEGEAVLMVPSRGQAA